MPPFVKFSGTLINFKETKSLICCVFLNKLFFTQVSSLMGQSNKLCNTLKTVLPSKPSDTQYPSDITPLDFNKFYTTVGVNL